MIAIGSDHGGFVLKQEIMAHLKKLALVFSLLLVVIFK